MKTPREILFARHQAVTPKLDAIRHKAIEQLNRTETNDQGWPAFLVVTLRGCSHKLWQELVWPSRQIWTGLAAIWVLIFIVNFSQRDGSQAIITKSTPETAMTFRDQQKLLNELFADQSLPVDAERPRTFSPKPRTEITPPLTA